MTTTSPNKFEVVAILPDGQTMRDEVHIGMDAVRGRPMTLDRAEDLVAELEAERPEGHEDVAYEAREID